MNIQKTRILLDKLNRLFETISSDSSNIAKIEMDLMNKYIRDMYESVNEIEAKPVPVKQETPPVSYNPKPQIKETPKVTPPPVVKEEPVVQAPPVVREVPVAPPVVKEVPVAPPVVKEVPVVQAPPVVKEIPVVPPVPVQTEKVQEVIVEKKKVVVKEPNVVEAQVAKRVTPNQNGKFKELFAFSEATELSQKLSEAPIANLKLSMGINERFLTINDLFGGDASSFEESINALNTMGNMQGAQTYLEKNVIPKYDWMDDNRKKKAVIFIRKVRRRYIG